MPHFGQITAAVEGRITANPQGRSCLIPAHFLVCILSFVFSVGLSPVGHAQEQKRVLVLYSTRRDAELSTFGDRDFPRIVAEEMKSNIDYYSEYLDMPRFPNREYENHFFDALAIKYRSQH